ncbi:MAG TPA: hypothetical protein VGM88_01190 [Kofleriaceae bacterium]|jgi:hypothetical protein
MKRTIGILLVAGAAVGAYKWHASSTAPAHGVSAADRVWIDHLPQNGKEKVQAFVMVSEASMGVFDRSSQWEGAYQLFRFEQNGQDIRAMFPQSGKGERWIAETTECAKNGFDYCLHLTGASQGVQNYYSKKGWEVRGGDADAAVRAILPKD